MRIGIDLLGIQSAESRGRGIGRYGRGLLSSLLDGGADREFVLYAHLGLPQDDIPRFPNATLHPLSPATRAGDPVRDLARDNPDRLDVLLVLSPFELHQDYDPPPRSVGGLPLAAVVYDLIPFLFQERYLTYPPVAMRFYRNLERLRAYDALLAISEATAADARRLLGLSRDRTVAIGGASDPGFFVPDRSEPIPEASRAVLDRIGLDAPYVFCLASTDERKNLDGLLDAFALLPEHLRLAHQVVVTCALTGPEADEVRRRANARGLGDQLVLTGQIDDASLRVLYQRCRAFVFPSHYEGFGLPILEAMHCGVPVLAGNNSSQVEVAGDAALLANSYDPADIARALEHLLGDRAFSRELGERGHQRARDFHWRDVGRRALEALERVAATKRQGSTTAIRTDTGHAGMRRTARTSRPRLAFVSPLPPKATGISDYSVRLLRELRHHFDIDLYHDVGYEPDLGSEARFDGTFDHRLFARRSSVLDYRGVLYQMGNSYYHGYLYEMLRQHPGIVTLHDVNLVGFHFWRGHEAGRDPFEYFRAEILTNEPARYDEIVPSLRALADEPNGLESALVRRNLRLNRSVVAAARAIVVHSDWARDRLLEAHPDRVGCIEVVPHGAELASVEPERRNAMRARYGLPADALIVASFGILHSQKMNIEALDAFAAVAGTMPSSLFVFIGPDHGSGAARKRAEALGLTGRVRFLGRRSDTEFSDLLAVPDVGVSLRRPPTNGETSGALLHLLRHGVPTIVTDVDAFSDYPGHVVRKVRWDAEGPAELERAMRELVLDADARARYGQAAREHIETHQTWQRVAALYADVIERFADHQRGGPAHTRRRSTIEATPASRARLEG